MALLSFGSDGDESRGPFSSSPRPCCGRAVVTTSLGTGEAVEFATLAWVDWFNTRRLLAPLGHVPPIGTSKPSTTVRRLPPWGPESTNRVSGEPGAVHSRS